MKVLPCILEKVKATEIACISAQANFFGDGSFLLLFGIMFPNARAKMNLEIQNGNKILCYLKITHSVPKMHSLWVYWLWIPPATWIQLLLHLFTGSSDLAQDHKVSVMPTQQLEGKWLRKLV